MDKNESDFINNILSGSESYLESDEQDYKTIDAITSKREEALYYLYEQYLSSETNQNNLGKYLETMTDYEYVEDSNELNYGDFVRYPILDDLDDIKIHTGGYIAKLEPVNKFGEPLHHLFLLKAPRAQENTFGIKKTPYWHLRKDSIIFRKLTQDDKLKASIAELLADLLD
jgi:hypothetical protein